MGCISDTSGIHAGGFTLLEILMAIAIAGIVFSAVLSVYTTTLDVSEQVDSASSQEQTARLIFEQLQKDLEGLYSPSGNGSSSPGPYEFIGGRSMSLYDTTEGDIVLQFGTTSILDFEEEFPRHCRAQLRYVLKKLSPSSEIHLLLREQRIFPELRIDSEEAGGYETIELANNVRELKCSFKDQEGLEQDSWQTGGQGSGDETGAGLPESVRVRLTLTDDSGKGKSYQTSLRFQ